MQRRGLLRALSLVANARSQPTAGAGRVLGWQQHQLVPGTGLGLGPLLRRRFLSSAFQGEARDIPRDPARQ
ncbi:hypothetical protein MNEG_7893, partial [Monoraphidium neglectum]